jgi:chemotaxis protein methyltransferase CheR
MQESISDEDFEKLLQIFERYIGTGHLKLRKHELCKNLATGAAKLRFNSTQELIDKLVKSNGADGIDSLIEYFTVGETYFFRHKQCFDVIIQDILPALMEIASLENRNELNIWCAACSSGEEPYSLAMLLDNTGIVPSGWQINIYASDINQEFLKRAAEGIYSEWSFRELPGEYLQKYLKALGKNRYELDPRLRKKVKFFTHNLLSHEMPDIPNLDLILCRNVLIYFNQKQIGGIFNKFESLLHADGWLLTSPAEVAADPDSLFAPVCCSGVYFYRKKRPEQEKPVVTDNKIRLSPKKPVECRAKPAAPQTKPKPAAKSIPKPEPRKTEAQTDSADLLNMAKNRNAKASPEQAAAMARCCADAGQLELALHWSSIAIKEDNLNPEAHYLHAHILRENGDIEEALRELKKVLFLNPDFIAGYFACGMLQLKNGKRKEALRNLRNAEKMLSGMDDSMEVAGCEGMTVRNMRETILKIIS